ncbi:MAG: ABC transporter substrate-binding protein [Firmicutes bacterium]|nr:ABC transporter substrate-binding protein [Bacillota bacterium]
MKKVSIILVLLLLLGLLFTGSGCTSQTQVPEEGEGELIKLRLSEVIRSMFYAPQYVAISKGFFRDEGLDITLGTAWGADMGAAALISKTADVALFGPEAAIYICAQGAENPIIAFAQLTSKDGSFLVGREPEPDFEWENVKGKVIIGGRKGGVPQMTLEYALKKNGIEPFVDVDIIQNIHLSATAGAFSGGTGDYVQLWQPGPAVLEDEGVGYTVASLGAATGLCPNTVFHATENFIEENPEIIKKFTTAVYKAMLWVEENPAPEVADAIEMFFPDTGHEIITKTIEVYKGLDIWAPNPILQKESLDRLQDIMILAGELEEKVPYEKVVNTTFAQEVMSAP